MKSSSERLIDDMVTLSEDEFYRRYQGAMPPDFSLDVAISYVRDKGYLNHFIDRPWDGTDCGCCLNECFETGTKHYEVFDAERGIKFSRKVHNSLETAVRDKLERITNTLQVQVEIEP